MATNNESGSEEPNKFYTKMKANPTVPLGLLGLTSVVVYGIYNFKNKKIKPSLYIIQLRVAAQGTLIGCMSLGLLYALCKNQFNKFYPEKKN